ncbi:hypothetical protein N431DRAFT_203737 [Stipitochalara longipes BDJ]|nr:hypothetical protein N431DRAFT_203737 [Stipitochalara longipes BDJ]
MRELNRRCNQSKLLLDRGGWGLVLSDFIACPHSCSGFDSWLCADEFILALDGRMFRLDPVQRKETRIQR